MKRTLTALLAAVMLFGTLTACSSTPATDAGTTTPDAGTTAPDTSKDSDTSTDANTDADADVDADVSFSAPILLTSGGQSADYQMINTVMAKGGMEATMNNLATSADLDGISTLVVVLGGSSKGLGAAGIDENQELARLTELLDAAVDADISILVMHTGGAARRGDLSDKFITPIMPYADYAIVVETGDTDGLMAGICADNGIHMDAIASIADVVTILPELFA